MTAKDRPGSESSAAIIGEPSFADAIEAIGAAADLTEDQKRYWPTSLRMMGVYLNTPLVMLPARISAVSARIKALHPDRLGVPAKTFGNHRASVKAALRWFNRQMGTGRKAPMDPAWRNLWDMVEDSHAKDMLSPLFRYLTGIGVAPDEVTDQHVDGFVAYRRETSFADVKVGWHRLLVRHWNACLDQVPGWPQVRLTEPPLAKRFSGPQWEEFPEGLRSGIDAYCASLTKPRRSKDGRRLKRCKDSTIETRRRELVAAVRTADEAGIPLDDLQSLAELLRPDRVEAIILHYWAKNGEEPALYTIDLAWRFLSLARSEPQISAAERERLEEIWQEVEIYRKSGLTEKNQELVLQVTQGETWRKVVQLPAQWMAEARACRQTKPIHAAGTAQTAVLVRILSVAPARIANIASIRLDINLTRPGGPGTPYMLVFPDYDTKNRVALQFPLGDSTTAMIDEYIHEFRPHLMRGHNHDYLFPGNDGVKVTQTLGEQISKRLRKALGLKVTPHQFRHAAAAIMLKEQPGNYERVRRVLGHRNIQTTINFYVGLEALDATRVFGEIVTRLIEDDPAGPDAFPPHPRRRREKTDA